MKRVLFTCILTLSVATICRADCRSQIESFYKNYLINVATEISNTKNEALCKRYLTPTALEQVAKLIKATGSDPIIRAQYSNKTAVETVAVTNLEGDNYMVSYLWDKDDTKNVTKIPIKAMMVDGQCKITYFAPDSK